MSFAAVETSRHSGRPAELYFFKYGSGPNSYHAYTNAESAITFEGITYRPVPIQRDAIRTNGTLDKSLLGITLPKSLEVPELFRVYPPSQVVQVVIRQGHVPVGDEEPEFLVVWTGRVINSDRMGMEAKLGCEPVQTSMRRTGLRMHYQYSCPHELYGPRCRAIKRLYPATVAEIDGTTLTLEPDWNTSPHRQDKFVGGLVEWYSTHNFEPRTILRRLGPDRFLLSGFLRGLEPGLVVNVALGCNHQLRDCESLHANVRNYGGCPWIPFESPFGKNPF